MKNYIKTTVSSLLLLVISLFLATSTVSAVPVCPEPVLFEQPNGMSIQVFLKGDEFLSWSEDVSGNLIIFDNTLNGYCYAEWTNDGSKSTGELIDVTRTNTKGNSLTKGNDIPENVTNNAMIERKDMSALLSDDKSFNPTRITPLTSSPPVPANVSDLVRKTLIVHITWSNRAGIIPPKLTGGAIYDLVFNPNTNSINKYFQDLIGTTSAIIVPAASTTSAAITTFLDNMPGIIEISIPGVHTNPYNNSVNQSSLLTNAITSACALILELDTFDTNKNGTLETKELLIGFIVDGYEGTIAGNNTCSFWAELSSVLLHHLQRME